MSYTEIYKVTKSGNTKLFAEIKNSHRGAMSIWNYLEEKYLPPLNRYGMKISRAISFEKEDIDELWGLQHDNRLSESEKIALLSTFDNVVVLKQDIPRLCKSFREFPGNTSLHEQADLIEKLINDRHCFAVFWNQTSVNADVPKNISGKYWNLFEHSSL